MANGDIAVGLFDLGDSPATVDTTVQSVAAAVGLTPSQRASYRVSDLWAHTATRTSGPISASLPAHGSALLRLAVG